MNINPFGPYYAGALRTAIASCFINGKISEQQIDFVKEVSAKFTEAEACGIMDEVRREGKLGESDCALLNVVKEFRIDDTGRTVADSV